MANLFQWGAMGRGNGSRSAVLEAIDLSLPFLQSPKELIGRHVLLEVDNVTADMLGKRNRTKETQNYPSYMLSKHFSVAKYM